MRKKGLWPVAGIDEVGRGCLAGPVAAAAVILNPADVPKGLNDSKRLSAAVREALYEEILTRALAVAFAFVSAADIDRINIRQASLAAMRRALAGLAVAPRYVLIDGNDLPQGLACPGETIVKGRWLVGLDRRGLDRRQSGARPSDDAPLPQPSRPMDSAGTSAMRRKSISKRSPHMGQALIIG